MNRLSVLLSAGLRAASVAGLALAFVAAPRVAAAQDPAAADPLKFDSSGPAMILIQIHAEKTTEFESAWAAIRAGIAKADSSDLKAFGDTLSKLFKVDQPPLDTPAGKAVLYVLQIDAPSTTISYNPFRVVYEQLWKNGQEGAALSRAEADAIYEKLKAAFQNINPPWKLIRVQ